MSTHSPELFIYLSGEFHAPIKIRFSIFVSVVEAALVEPCRSNFCSRRIIYATNQRNFILLPECLVPCCFVGIRGIVFGRLCVGCGVVVEVSDLAARIVLIGINPKRHRVGLGGVIRRDTVDSAMNDVVNVDFKCVGRGHASSPCDITTTITGSEGIVKHCPRSTRGLRIITWLGGICGGGSRGSAALSPHRLYASNLYADSLRFFAVLLGDDPERPKNSPSDAHIKRCEEDLPQDKDDLDRSSRSETAHHRSQEQ